MGTVKQINIKNRTYYFYNDIIDPQNFKPNLLKMDKNSYNNTGIHNVGYITIKKIYHCENINSVNPLYLRITHANRYIGEINENKYLIFDSTDENRELLNKYNDVFNEIRDKIKEISIGECDYEKDYMKIAFNYDDDLPLNKPLKFDFMAINIRSIFKEDDRLYRQVFPDDTLYELHI